MFRRQFLLSAVAAAGIAVLPFSLALGEDAPKKIVAAINPHGVPFAFQEGTEFKGVMYDLLQEIAQANGATVDYSPLGFAAMIPALQVNQVDIAVTGFFVTEERKKVIDFSAPIFVQGSVLVVPADSPITSVEGLRGKVIAAQQGSAPLKVAQAHADEWGVEIRILADGANMKLAMQTGDVAGLIYDSAVVNRQIAQEAAHPTQKIISELLQPTDIAFGFPKDSKLLPIVNDGLAKLRASGELERILKSYDL